VGSKKGKEREREREGDEKKRKGRESKEGKRILLITFSIFTE